MPASPPAELHPSGWRRRMYRGSIRWLSVLAVLAGSCANDPSGPSGPYDLWFSQPNQRIVFMSRAHSPAGELYLIDKSGEVTRLTWNDRHENNPALSRDGTRVAYQAGDEADMTTWEIYVLDIASGTETRLTYNTVIDAHPDWGPGDSLLIFSSWRDSLGNPTPTADIYTMRTDGSGQTALLSSQWEDNDAEWSPDGERIAFKSNRDTGQDAREEIFVMNADGSGVTRLTATIGWQSDHDPSWSPDSRFIVFSRYDGTRPWTDVADPAILQEHWQELIPWNVFRVDLQGNETRLTDVEHVASLPVYSSTGASVLYLGLEFLIDPSGILVGADHRLMLVPESGGSGEQMIPDDEHTPTMEYHDW